ncbi:MAG: Trk system potassium transporter TrkA [Bacteroidetes bacterium]|nr:Trk system potassium transporter TrkA [Bacteroidota bacterium]MBU1718809.1 Trk system potassium transporter TrkA [Bacteroidota bacterium]
MNIVIAGDGEVGFHVAKMLTNEKHNITIVDPQQDLLKMIESHTDLMTIAGNSTNPEILLQAKADKADLVISVVHEEQTNILTAIIAKKLGAKKTIARINSIEFLRKDNLAMLEGMGIDYIVSPEFFAAQEIAGLVQQSAATEVIDFSNGKLSLFLLRLDENATVLEKTLDQVASEHSHLDFRAIAIHRKSKTIIPKGKDKFQLNDLAYVITKSEGVHELLQLGGKLNLPINDIIIIGGGRVGKMTAKMLEKERRVKLIDIDKERCMRLTDLLDNTLIINGDARQLELLEDEGIETTDALVAVTNNSETNILTCVLAKKYGVRKTIALVENIDYIDIAQSMGIDAVINKKLIAAGHIFRFTMQSKVASIKCLSGIDAEVLEFIATKNSAITKKPIRLLDIPKGAIIGGIIRDEDAYIAVGDFQIKEGDKVVVFSLPECIQKVDELFN